jgi:hypothetical protein
MIYILIGGDVKNRNDYINSLSLSGESVRLDQGAVSKDAIIDLAHKQNLFSESQIFIVDNLFSSLDVSFSKENLLELQNSKNTFISIEDKLLASEEKKYNKYAIIKRFIEKKIVTTPKINTFAIADAYGRHDKISTWILYREAIKSGSAPEAISGMLFWKIKNMVLTGSKNFSTDILKRQSSALVSLYHQSHRGESDLSLGLEQFILASLSK